MAGLTRWRAWSVLALYVVVLYGLLPLGPAIGLGAIRTAPGAWLLGPGLGVIGAVVGVTLLVRLWRRGAPPWAFAVLVAAALGYAFAFTSLRAQRLERTHLAEYGIAAWLAWRAVTPHVRGPFAAYVAAVLLGTAIGWGDELVQGLLPNRVYDLRDVAMNAAGAVLGVLVIAACRAERVSDGSSSRRSPPAAGSSAR